ncbi:MAG: choice-of-anchor Q domain-containing protein [Saprospiraceae bacterium]
MKAISLKNNKFEGYLISNVTGTGFISYANCIITGNISTVPTYYILNLSSDTLKFTNCTFADNTIPQLDMPNASTYKTATNCIFSGSINKKFFLSTNNHAEYSYCHFDELDCQNLGPTITCGPGNLIGLNPLFRDTANNDFSLLPCSPLIDAGSNAAAAGLLTDISGAPRIQGGTVDIGAYESPTLHLSDSTQIRPACESANGGSISLVPDYGCGPFDYQWDPPVSSGPTANDLAPGDYSFTITDSRGQVFSDTFSIGAAVTHS